MPDKCRSTVLNVALDIGDAKSSERICEALNASSDGSWQVSGAYNVGRIAQPDIILLHHPQADWRQVLGNAANRWPG
ncbi:MAG: hypothetical protein JW942_00120, partial [Opitutales bacterium]|nr:hypothetical protein [Opitutales bacterium]